MGGSSKANSALKAFVAALGNFSVQYNFGCVSMAVKFMSSHWGQPTGKGAPADFPEPDWAKQALVPAVFAGSFFGMILMGYVGDIIGRRKGMMLTLSFVVIGALVSAAASWGSPQDVYAAIMGARFMLGFGVGGIYPMAAATAAENNADAAEEEEEEGDVITYDPAHAVQVASAFFWQTPGGLAPYIVALALTAVPSSENSTSIQFRTLLGLGAIPASIVFLASFWTAEEPAKPVSTPSATAGTAGSSSKRSSAAGQSPLTILRNNPKHLWSLLGTGGVWFLYDISFYGTSIFTPQILSSIFGPSETLLDVAWQSLVVGAMGVPGIFSSVALLRPRPIDGASGGAEAVAWEYRWPLLPAALDRRLCGWSARDLNYIGFLLMAACFFAMAVLYQVYPGTEGSAAKFATFCIIQFSLNWGPNPGTYVQPTQSFPRAIRTTMHGLSAAAGKAGAVVGTFMYAPMEAAVGLAPIMWLQAVLSLLGCVASLVFIPVPTYAPAGHGQGQRGKAKSSKGVDGGEEEGEGEGMLASSGRGGGGAGGGGGRGSKGVGKGGNNSSSSSSYDQEDDQSDKPLLDA